MAPSRTTRFGTGIIGTLIAMTISLAAVQAANASPYSKRMTIKPQPSHCDPLFAQTKGKAECVMKTSPSPCPTNSVFAGGSWTKSKTLTFNCMPSGKTNPKTLSCPKPYASSYGKINTPLGTHSGMRCTAKTPPSCPKGTVLKQAAAGNTPSYSCNTMVRPRTFR
ncbi:MAG: hypothetical protein ACPG06_08985 [Alphaproteobacteria bacterium]